MARVCVRHPFELSDNFCSHCGLEFCRDCLVYPKGLKKAALCVPCALTTSGVRSNAATSAPISKRELKRRIKEREEETRVLALHERAPAAIAPITNPFSPGWAFSSEEPPEHSAPEREPVAVTVEAVSAPLVPAPLPPPIHPPEFVAPDSVVVADITPTLEDLLPNVGPAPVLSQDHAVAALAALSSDEDEETEPIELRKPRSLPLLRRREPEPVDNGSGASEMIAWLDEVFAPKDMS